jgi:RHS repeat-associated protein
MLTAVSAPAVAEVTGPAWSDPAAALRSNYVPPHLDPSPPAPRDALPLSMKAPTGPAVGDGKRVAERPELRTATRSVYALDDGRLQAEVSPLPVHYQDSAGAWQDIDTTVRDNQARDGWALADTSNAFASYFGTSTDRLASVRLADRSVVLGLNGPAAPAQPKAERDQVTFPNAAGGADLRYRVTPLGLKEDILLTHVPERDPSWVFTVDAHGVDAVQRPDGSIVFTRTGGDPQDPPVFTMPKPFMYDATAPIGKVSSDKVSQTLNRDGDKVTVTVSADPAWLRSSDRKYPVTVDPTISIQPTPMQAQDVMVSSDTPDANQHDSWRLSVGTSATGISRGLLKFDLAQLPANTLLDSAQLKLYFDQDHTTSDKDVPLEAHRATLDWQAGTATWNATKDGVGDLGSNTEQVTSADNGKVAATGEWVSTADDRALPKSHRVNRGGNGAAFTWVPRVTEVGDYLVQAHYVPAADRATNAPYTVAHRGGQDTVAVNQTQPEDGGWATLGTWGFDPGTQNTITLRSVGGKTVSADAVRLVKAASVVKKANEANAWHTYSVRSIVQSWLDGTQSNQGFVVKAANETALGQGGPRYEAARFAYEGERAQTPKLVLTYGKPGAVLDEPTTTRATGADLTWQPYRNPTGKLQDDVLEYQLHRSVFQNFLPTASTLIAPISPDQNAYQDTTATPTTADDPQPFGNAFYYQLAVRTKSGEFIPSQSLLVRLPKAGQIKKVLRGTAANTTLTAKQPDTGHDQLTGAPWSMAGNNSGTFGPSRSLVKFPGLDKAGIPVGARVQRAEIDLWSFNTTKTGTDATTYELHGLTKDFDQRTASWNNAAAGRPWSTPGGDYDSTVAASAANFTNDPAWRTWNAPALVQGWVNNPASNHGALVKVADEARATERTLFLNTQAAEPKLRPQLVIVYTEQTAEGTYYAPTTPDRMIPGDDHTVPVTITNTTGAAWPKKDWVLSYHWALPDGSDITNAGNRAETELSKDLNPGDIATINAAKVLTAVPFDPNTHRKAFLLRWELRNRTTGKWLSDVGGVPALEQRVVIEDPKSDQLGQEKFYSYSPTETGAGSTLLVNQANGNAVWSYNAFTHPDRGPSTFLRLSYNSQDTGNSYVGYAWSVSASSVMRLGSPLEFHGDLLTGYPGKITLADGDGTSHTYTLNTHGSGNTAVWDYDNPAGVHDYLQKAAGSGDRAWVMTRPDSTQFWFDEQGYQTATVDRNGNTLTFTYERSSLFNRNTGILKYVTDASGRRVLSFEYYRPGEPAYDYYHEDMPVSGTNLINTQITRQVKAVTDITGRRVELVYSDHGLLQRITDGAGTDDHKTFTFFYNNSLLEKNAKLISVTDPRGNSTGLAYTDDWKAKSVTDRNNKATGFDYRQPDPNNSAVESTVTDANGHPSVTLVDGFGRPIRTTNAKHQTAELTWDADNNVRRLAEDGGKAVTTWVYDPNTGYPTEIKDAEANAANGPPTKLGYRTGLNGHIADLVDKTSPEGRKWLFTLDARGNLAAVTDPKGSGDPTSGHFTTRYAYDDFGQLISAVDANGHETRFGDYDATGYPTRTTDPYGHDTLVKFDAVGNVLHTVDAKQHQSDFTYDVFGRPRTTNTPKDAANNVYIFTPGPTYDANDNVIRAIAPNNAVTAATYTKTDQAETVTTPKDHPTDPDRIAAYRYDNVGNLIAATEPDGNVPGADPAGFTSVYHVDDLNQVDAITDPAKGVTKYVYDNVGNVTTVIDPNKTAGGDPNAFTTKYAYNLNHQVTSVTDAAGNQTGRGYDRDGNVTSLTDQDHNTTLLRFDQRGMPDEQWVPHAKDDRGTITYRKTRFEYDEAGNRTKVISPRGMGIANNTTDFAAVTVYDKLDRITEQWTPYAHDDPEITQPDKTLYTYDEVGNLVDVSAPPSNGQAFRNIAHNTYFDTGWLRSSVDPWSITTSYDYNELGAQTTRAVTAAGGAMARAMGWDYYPDGKLRARTDTGLPTGRNTLVIATTDPQAMVTGDWGTAGNGPSADYEGYQYRLHNAGNGTNTVAWNIDAPVTGTYEVAVRYTKDATAHNAIYTVVSDTGTDTKTVDQTQQQGQWVSLGSYKFTEGQPRSVTVSDKADGTVVANAVRIVRDGSTDGLAPTAAPQKTFGYAYDATGNLTRLTDSTPDTGVDTYTLGYTPLNQIAKVEERLKGVVQNTTTYAYYPNGNLKTLNHDKQNATYEYDLRDLVAKATITDSGGDPQVTSYPQYTPRGQVQRQVKANGNIVDTNYWLDGLAQHEIEHKPDNTVVSEHTIDYDLDGNRVRDQSKTMNADNHGAYVEQVQTFTYDPRDRIRKLAKTRPDGSPIGEETYTHDANNNVTAQTVDSKTTRSTYDRNRLITSTIDKATATSVYDPFGRLDKTTSGSTLIEKYQYDGFDRIVEQQKLKDGSSTEHVVARNTYDPLDRTVSKTENPGAGEKKTDFTYLGLSGQLLTEDLNGRIDKSYQYSPTGERLSQVKRNDDGSKEPGYFGYNAHSDVEQVTDNKGDTKATYGYTAYGNNDSKAFTGVDKPTPQDPGKQPYNAFRFNAKRWDNLTGNYDMGFRTYSPGRNQFLTRDNYNGALNDLGLDTDPWTGSRYAFGGGNPVSRVELDGHCSRDGDVDVGCGARSQEPGAVAAREEQEQERYEQNHHTLAGGTTFDRGSEGTFINGVSIPTENAPDLDELASRLDSYLRDNSTWRQTARIQTEKGMNELGSLSPEATLHALRDYCAHEGAKFCGVGSSSNGTFLLNISADQIFESWAGEGAAELGTAAIGASGAIGRALRGGAAPVAKGAAGTARLRRELLGKGYNILGSEISIRTSAKNVRVDLVAEKNGTIYLFDVKNGPAAGFTKNQQVGYPAIEAGGGAYYGKNARDAGLSGAFGPTPVNIVQY